MTDIKWCKVIHLPKTQREVLLHRLEVINDPGHLAELFEDHENLNQEKLLSAVERFVKEFNTPRTIFEIRNEEEIEILVDCVEGSTFFGAEDATPAQHRAMDALAQKLTALSGANVTPVHH